MTRLRLFLIAFASGLAGLGVAHADLAADYAAIRAEATARAGNPLDMPKRAVLLDEIYRDSKGNHRFPLVALHGALWGYNFFQATGPIGDEVSKIYFYSKREVERRRQMLRDFSAAFAKTNRAVFIDTYTNYYFTKAHGTETGAERFLAPELLAALNRVHAAAAGQVVLNQGELREIFQTALKFEQESTVGPRIQAAVDRFDCKLMEFFALHPVVHFAYFPDGTKFYFRNFANKAERIRRALASYDLAAAAGWPAVEAAMHDYGVVFPAN